VIERRRRKSRANEDASAGFLWRSSSRFRSLVRENAKTLDISQNAYITSTLLLSAIELHKERPSKRALASLIEEMNAAFPDDRNIMCDCSHEEWSRLKQLITVLEDAGVVAGLHLRHDARTAKTTYSFRFTPEGRDVWKALSPRLREAAG